MPLITKEIRGIFSFKMAGQKQLDSIDSQILRRIRSKGGGWVFTPADFRDLGSRTAMPTSPARLVSHAVAFVTQERQISEDQDTDWSELLMRMEGGSLRIPEAIFLGCFKWRTPVSQTAISLGSRNILISSV